MSKRETRKRHVVSYAEPKEGDIWRQSSIPTRWQQDWDSGSEEEEEQEEGQEEKHTDLVGSREQKKGRREEQRENKRRKTEAVAAAMAASAATAAASGDRLSTREQTLQELKDFIEINRNTNTNITYKSGWRQFIKWVREIENPKRTEDNKIMEERPNECDVVGYMRYMVVVKQATITSVSAALAAISDHLKYEINKDYSPCQGKFVDAMKAVLVPMAKPAQQKQEIGSLLLSKLIEKIKQEEDISGLAATVSTKEMEKRYRQTQRQHTARRDRCMILLAYNCYLRTSEIARMRRSDISFTQERIQGVDTEVMRVYVDPACKNDVERKGHERLIMDGATGSGQVAETARSTVLCVKEYMLTLPANQQLMFTTYDGKSMSPDTPRGRLRHWLEQIGVQDAYAFGFHSLRAGAATDAVKAGVHERYVKEHGNWRSEGGMKPYIRMGVEEKVLVSRALNQT